MACDSGFLRRIVNNRGVNSAQTPRRSAREAIDVYFFQEILRLCSPCDELCIIE